MKISPEQGLWLKAKFIMLKADFKIIKLVRKMQPKYGSAQGLLDLAKWAENQDFDLPKDLGKNHNKYIWGK